MASANDTKIDSMNIHYKRHGSGPSILLLIHGAVGSYNDFHYQMDKEFGFSATEFTIIAPDLPGNGKSELISGELKPCEPSLDYYQLCANVCAQLMDKLRFRTYSVGGWDDGARVAALLAIKCQSRVNGLILWGFTPVMDKKSCLAVSRVRDTSMWEPSILKYYTDVYGEQQFSDMWRHYVDFVVKALELPDTFDIRKNLSDIKCPTLVLHGSKDPMISYNDHVRPIHMQIYNSEIRQLPDFAHNIHQADPGMFNQTIIDFVAHVGAH